MARRWLQIGRAGLVGSELQYSPRAASRSLRALRVRRPLDCGRGRLLSPVVVGNVMICTGWRSHIGKECEAPFGYVRSGFHGRVFIEWASVRACNECN